MSYCWDPGLSKHLRDLADLRLQLLYARTRLHVSSDAGNVLGGKGISTAKENDVVEPRMSLILHGLLRLPACLRRQALLDGIPPRPSALRPDITGSIARRVFSNTSRTLGQAQFGKPPGAALAAKSQPPPLRSTTPPPISGPSQINKPPSYLDTLFASSREVLLYRAPNHRSFFITSYLAGGLLVFGALNWANFALMRPSGQEVRKMGAGGYVALSISLLTSLFAAMVGTACFLAPSKMVRSIKVLHPSYRGIGLPTLRFEMRRPIPFMRTKAIEALPSKVFMDRQVSAMEINFTSVPLKYAAEFTADKRAHAVLPADLARQNVVLRALRGIQRNTQRMFLRDGFAYVRFAEGGRWKVDLQNCELLDNGYVLERLTKPDTEPKPSVLGLLFGGGK